MLSYSRQKYFVSLGLSLKEVFLYTIVKKLYTPIKINQLISIHPLLDVKERQLKQMLYKLEQANLFVKTKSNKGLLFILPYFKRANFRPLKESLLCKIPTLYRLLRCSKVPYIYYNNKTSNLKNNHKVVDYVKPITSFEYNQIKVLKEIFKKEYPKKNNFVKDGLPNNFKLDLFLNKIKQSPFISEKDNLGLTWCLKNYSAIISDYYAPYKTKTRTPEPSADFTQREYSQEFMNNLFDKLDE